MSKSMAAVLVAAMLFALSACVVTPLTPTPTPTPEYHILPYPGPEDAPSVRGIPTTLDPARTIRRLYFPLLASQRTPSILGWEAASDWQALTNRAAILALSPGTVRTGIPWKDVEPVRGAGYVWSASKDAHINMLARGDNRIIGILNWPPQWALVSPGCSPVAPGYYADWLGYVRATVKRYGDRVAVWEIINEPDAPISPADKGWGCWGDVWSPDQGGTEYGRFVAMTAKAIRTIQPNATILSGGLLLGCNVSGDVGGCTGASLAFLRAALPEMDGDIDGVGFHSYTYWPGTMPTATALMDAKVAALRKLTTLPLWNTEGGYLCYSATDPAICQSTAYEDAQAEYVRLWAASCRRLGLGSCVWYSLTANGWRAADLSDMDGTKRAGYWALAAALRE